MAHVRSSRVLDFVYCAACGSVPSPAHHYISNEGQRTEQLGHLLFSLPQHLQPSDLREVVGAADGVLLWPA